MAQPDDELVKKLPLKLPKPLAAGRDASCIRMLAVRCGDSLAGVVSTDEEEIAAAAAVVAAVAVADSVGVADRTSSIASALEL